MPELTFTAADGVERCCDVITVKMFRKYAELMEKNSSESVQEAVFFNAQILKNVFGTTEREAVEADVIESLAAAKAVHFVMQEIVIPKFLELSPDGAVEQEKSAFDDYDEEEGYNEEEDQRSIWAIHKENTDRIVKISVRVLKNSYSQCMESDIMSLLDYLKYEIKTVNEQ